MNNFNNENEFDELESEYLTISMTDENGDKTEFQLVYLCEIDDLEYAILTDIERDEDYIFEYIIDEDDVDASVFRPVQDEDIIEQVVEKYMSQLEFDDEE